MSNLKSLDELLETKISLKEHQLLEESGKNNLLFILKLSKWEERYNFPKDKKGFGWIARSQTKSGKLFETLDKCKINAFIHWLNNN